jgi:hypothetical protein
MAATIIVPVEQYLRTSYDPDMEYVDGALLERHVVSVDAAVFSF